MNYLKVDECFETLNEVADQFLDVRYEQEVYSIIVEALKKIIPEAYLLISKLQPDKKNFRIIRSSGIEKYFNTIKSLLGDYLDNIDFPVEYLSEAQIESFESRKLYYFPEGIYDLVNKKVSKTICQGIEEMLDIGQVCTVRFFVEQDYFGGMLLFIPNSIIQNSLFNTEVVMTLESISKQASVLIRNLRNKEALELKEQELIDEHEKFIQLVGQLNDVIWTSECDGSDIIDLNNSFERIYGYSSIEFIKNPTLWLDVVHPHDKVIAQKSAEQLLKIGSSTSEYRIIRSDGRILWLHDRKSIIYDKNGIPIQMGGRATDITDRKILEQELKIKNSALDDSPTAVGLADINGSIFYVNYAYVNLFEFNNKEEILGKKVIDVTDFKEQAVDILNCIQKGKTYSGEVKSIRNDGSYCYFIVSARAIISDNRPVCLMALFTDITERKQTEIRLLDLSDQLKESNKTKDKFFSIIAHDLKSPMNSLLGFTDLLANDYSEYTDERRLEFIKMINLSAQNTYKLLENLLEWARFQQGQIKFFKEQLNLRTIINECFDGYTLNAFEKRIEFCNDVSEDLILNIDRNSLKTILRNLISNALKFNILGGKIVIAATSTTDFIIISVQDTGVGIRKEKIGMLFKIEESISTTGTKGEKGTGLGLVLCKELTIKNQGEIDVESELGKGTTFKITFPRDAV